MIYYTIAMLYYTPVDASLLDQVLQYISVCIHIHICIYIYIYIYVYIDTHTYIHTSPIAASDSNTRHRLFVICRCLVCCSCLFKSISMSLCRSCLILYVYYVLCSFVVF